MKNILLITLVAICGISKAQEISGQELLDKTIQFHDPDGAWADLAVEINFSPEKRDDKTIHRTIEFNNKDSYFRYYKNDGENEIDQKLKNDECKITLNGSESISNEDIEKFKLTCDRVKWIRNYYVYLYGLPMKLKDSGTIIDPKVTKSQFMGMDYLKLKVSYEKEVGTDVWFFYINPDSYQMEAYQFYHDEATGKGEYITLEGLVEINGIKIPKLRKWYTNLEDKFLGADDISSINILK